MTKWPILFLNKFAYISIQMNLRIFMQSDAKILNFLPLSLTELSFFAHHYAIIIRWTSTDFLEDFLRHEAKSLASKLENPDGMMPRIVEPDYRGIEKHL